MRKLLVVDDQHDICDFVRKFFQDRGFEVFCALNGEEALSIAKREAPAVVLLDIRMKGMDGIATLKHLMDIDRTFKVIMVSGVDDQEKKDEAYRLGARDYIVKPLELDCLEQAVEKVLQ